MKRLTTLHGLAALALTVAVAACTVDRPTASIARQNGRQLTLSGASAKRLTRLKTSAPELLQYAKGTIGNDGKCQLALPIKNGYMTRQMEIDLVACESIVGFSRKWFDEMPKPLRVIPLGAALAKPAPCKPVALHGAG